ncbi:lysophosphatidic acid receptor 6-like [Polyodon spathula]|uniref:lysophosphatidic acid receptor 6-like n=1 Tax=Polyodon spathula TaxID=7913 RepID=UPI001B7F71AB|nr:lysophosphatidic acid receptor 6-like [Polyodon spathula]
MDSGNNTLANTHLNCTTDTSYRFVFHQVMYSFIFVFGLVGNGLALRQFCGSLKTANSTAIYMANLSVADLIFVASLPLRIYYYHHSANRWTPGRTFCLLTFTLKYISMYGGIFFLACIGMDRFFAVVCPLAKRLRKVRTARAISVGAWCLILVLSISLPFLRLMVATRQQPCLPDPSSRRNRLFILVILLLVEAAFLFPLFLLLFSYCSIIRTLRQPTRLAPSKPWEGRTMRMIYSVIMVFLFCFAPYHLNLFWFTLTKVELVQNCTLTKINQALHPVALTLASMNCCLNPLIYYSSSKMFHKESSTSSGSQ